MQHRLLLLFYVTTAALTILTQREEMILLVAAGLLYMFVKAPPMWKGKSIITRSFILIGIGFWQFEPTTLGKMALFFTKAGAFVFGSGLAIVPFLHNGVVQDHHWLTETEFVDAVAVAMITPGPVVITVAFIDFMVAGFPGAVVAALSTFLPCFLFTILPAPYFHKYGKHPNIKAFVDGITAAVIGALAGAVVVITIRTITDWWTAVIALAAFTTSLKLKRVKEPHIILAAAKLGVVLKLSFRKGGS